MAMQRNYFTILFFIKKSKLLKNGEAPICMRITVNGQRAEYRLKEVWKFPNGTPKRNALPARTEKRWS